MTELVAKFENSSGRIHKLRVKEANTELAPEEVKASLEKLTTLDLFYQEGVRLFDQVVTASYFETVETYLFDQSLEQEVDPEQASSEEERSAVVQAEVTAAGLSIPAVNWEVKLIEEELVEPTLLRQVLELPLDVTLKTLSQEQKRSLVVAKLPEGGQPLAAKLYEDVNPVRIELFAELKEEENRTKHEKRNHRRLVERLRKRRQS